MLTRIALVAATLLGLTAAQGCANGSAQHAHQSHQSPYAGQEERAIKSLSRADIQELKRGGGWGLAKAAELNGLPGPAHVLELKDEIDLSPEQTDEIQALFDDMQAKAIGYGERLIELEEQLERRFQSDIPTDEQLLTMLNEIGQVRSALRHVHLATHLKTPNILSAQQVAAYNALRGYGAGDPCRNIPKGHDPLKWKKHNRCD